MREANCVCVCVCTCASIKCIQWFKEWQFITLKVVSFKILIETVKYGPISHDFAFQEKEYIGIMS